jgi:dihydrofolate reductase
VLTRNPDWQEEGAEAASSVEDALKIANAPHVWVIGGGEVYRLFLPHADRVELTEVDIKVDGDATFPNLGNDWEETEREHRKGEGSTPSFDFVTLRRR